MRFVSTDLTSTFIASTYDLQNCFQHFMLLSMFASLSMNDRTFVCPKVRIVDRAYLVMLIYIDWQLLSDGCHQISDEARSGKRERIHILCRYSPNLQQKHLSIEASHELTVHWLWKACWRIEFQTHVQDPDLWGPLTRLLIWNQGLAYYAKAGLKQCLWHG